jgi:hypothetical protein
LPWVRLPEPKAETISRHASETEVFIERIFREYLRYIIESSEQKISLRYIPTGTPEAEEEIITSPSAAQPNIDKTQHVEFRVLSPSFYSNFAHYTADSHSAFQSELARATISLSLSLSLSPLIFNPRNLTPAPLGFLEKLYWLAIRCLRPALTSPQPRPSNNPAQNLSEFETFILTRTPSQIQRSYKSKILKLFLAEHLAFGWIEILSLELFLLKCVGMWVLVGCL